MAEILTTFENGNINLQLDNGRKIKLPSHVVDGLRAVRSPETFLHLYRSESFFSVGPDRIQVKNWEEETDVWKHQAYLSVTEICEIMAALDMKRRAAAISANCMGQKLHTCSPYRQWRAQMLLSRDVI